MGMPQPVGYLYWYTTSVILGILTLLNLVSIGLRHIARRSRSQATATASTTKELDSACSSPTTSSSTSSDNGKDVEELRVHRRLGTVERFARAATLALDKYLGLTAIPLPRWRFWVKRARAPAGSVATTEVIWTVVYTFGCLFLSFYGTNMRDVKSYANQAAWISAAQMPLIIALAGKNNLVSFLTGIGYEKLNFLHRAAGRVCFLGIWIHAGGYFYILGGFHSENWATQLSRWGFTGLLAFTLLTVTSVRWVRQRIYEFFLVTHICLAALTLAAFIMHWRAVDKWIYPGIGLWAADRLFRILRLVILNKLYTVKPYLSPTASNLPSTATLTLLTPSTLKVSFPAPASTMRWSAGQHFYVVMPGMARLPWEAHPFTAATVPLSSHTRGDEGSKESGELTFVVRVRDGFTKRMKERVDAERKAQGLGIEEECQIQVKAAVEGPYGQVRKMDLYDGVLIVAGGSGISFAVAHLLQVIQDAKAGKPHPRYFSIVWMVKSRLHLNWIAPILLAHAQAIPPSLRVSLHIHVTRHYIPRASVPLPPTAALPADPGQADDTWQSYLARRAAEPPRRKSRLMSTMSWATWTGAFDTDGQSGTHTGNVTRRGSTMVPASARPEGQAEAEVEPKFVWSEGYNDGEAPAGNAPVLDRVPRMSVRGRASEAPSFSALRETEDGDSDEKVNVGPTEYDEPPISMARAYTPTTRRPSSVLLAPDSPRRGSLALASAGGAGGPRRKSSTGILLDTPPRRNLSISIEEPAHIVAARRRSSVHSGSTPSSPSSSRRGSNLPPVPLYTQQAPVRPKSSGLLNVTLPDEDPTPPLETEEKQEDDLFSPSPAASIAMPRPELAAPAPAFLAAPIMIKTSSQHSGISIRSTTGPSTPTSLMPILRSESPFSPASPGGSGIRTPSLSIQKPDLTQIADAENPSALLEQTFAASSTDRARQSVGLEGIVHWHEGRADLQRVIQDLMVAVGEGGVVNVEACGPRSLLDKTKDVVQGLSSVKAVWDGQTKVVYHAETFGW